ncbi:MAG: glycolate oxidase subunit GlcE, partial [SAR324 cluster bacterium]|nr:glycolate oxidase subunit GlcE [SAR324 cluster bacterium]
VPVDSNYPIFQPLEAGRRRLHVNLKQAFDPAGILNPGRMYPDF